MGILLAAMAATYIVIGVVFGDRFDANSPFGVSGDKRVYYSWRLLITVFLVVVVFAAGTAVGLWNVPSR